MCWTDILRRICAQARPIAVAIWRTAVWDQSAGGWSCVRLRACVECAGQAGQLGQGLSNPWGVRRQLVVQPQVCAAIQPVSEGFPPDSSQQTLYLAGELRGLAAQAVWTVSAAAGVHEPSALLLQTLNETCLDGPQMKVENKLASWNKLCKMKNSCMKVNFQ